MRWNMSQESYREEGRLEERKRCVGLVLAAYAEMKADGFIDCADRLDRLATAIEHPGIDPEDENGAGV